MTLCDSYIHAASGIVSAHPRTCSSHSLLLWYVAHNQIQTLLVPFDLFKLVILRFTCPLQFELFEQSLLWRSVLSDARCTALLVSN